MTAFKCQRQATDLQQRLQAISDCTIVESYDPNGMPILECTSVAAGIYAGGETLFIKIEVEPDPANPVDSLGLPQVIYSPSQATILEVPDAEASDVPFRALVTAQAALLGTKLLIYQVNPLPASYSLTGATLAGDIPSNAWNPLTQSE